MSPVYIAMITACCGGRRVMPHLHMSIGAYYFSGGPMFTVPDNRPWSIGVKT